MVLKKYIHILDNIPLFKNFTKKHLLEFFETIDYRIAQYTKGSIIFLENEPCKTFNIILAGTVQIQKIDSFGKILTIAEFQVGDTFGENLIFDNVNRFPMTAISKTNTIILHIQKEAVLYLCQHDVGFLTEFLQLISKKAITLTGKIKQVTLKTIRQKICEFLLDAYHKQRKLTIHLKMSKKEWADRIGVQRPSLSRELMKMKEEGLIDYDRHCIDIKDLNGIKKYL